MSDLLIIFSLALFFRYMVARKAPINFDTYGHLYFAKEVKRQNAGPFGEIKLKVVGNNGFSHPFLWHWLISFFQIEKVFKYQKWINLILDSLFTIFIYFIAIKIDFNPKEAFIVSLLYLFTPMWFSRLAIGPRIYSLTPRLFSEILSNVFFIVTLLPLGLPYWVVLIMGAIISGIALSSAKFSVQVLIFVTPIISLFAQSTTPIIALIIGFILAIIVSKGRIFAAFKEQYSHLTNYYIKNLRGEVPVSNRNSLQKLFGELDEHEGLLRKLMVVFNRMLSGNSFTGVLLKMPILPLTIILFLLRVNEIKTFNLNHINATVAGATIVFLIINIKRFLFLGEAERYLTHVAFFVIVAFLSITSELNLSWISWYILGYGVLFWLLESFFLKNVLPDQSEILKVSKEVISFLKKINKEMKILTFPYHAIGVWRIMLETEHKVVFANLDDKQGIHTNNCWYSADYPFVNLAVVDRMYDELGVNVLIIDNKQLKRKKEGWLPSALWNKLEIGAPFYTVYEINE
jgi:hypothetical protein